jgi:hypothetical protein
MNVVCLKIGFRELGSEILAYDDPGTLKHRKHSLRDNTLTIFWYQDQMHMQIGYDMSSATKLLSLAS